LDGAVADSAFFAFDEGGMQDGKLGFLFFQKAQGRTHHVARTAVATFFYLRLDEAAEMFAEAEGVFLLMTYDTKDWYC